VLSAENLSSIAANGSRILELARRNPDQPVPQYPGWDLRDLLTHTASIHGRTALYCETQPSERISAPRLPEGADALEWYEENLVKMLAALRESDPSAEVWTFGDEQNIGWWERRMVIETGVHRWDAEGAFGEESPLGELVARAGLDEFGEAWLPQLPEVPTLRVMATDINATWVFGEGDPELDVEGSASDLCLRLMSRNGVELPSVWAAAVDSLPPTPKR
jgi:uncharacterized protein (TIGR03083 family)